MSGVVRGPAWRLLALCYGIAAAVVAADQLTKELALRHLRDRPPVQVVGDFVQLRYTTNSGGAFSLLTGAPLFFAVMAAVIIVAIAWNARKVRGTWPLAALGLLLGGAVGNFTDRLLRGDAPLHGEVIDFIDVGAWPVFNVADSCIVVGGLLLALLVGRAEREPGGAAGRPAGEAGERQPGAGAPSRRR